MHIEMFWHEIKTSALKKKSSSMQLYINAHQKCVTKKCWSPKTTLEAIDSISNSYIYVLSKEPSVELPREY